MEIFIWYKTINKNKGIIITNISTVWCSSLGEIKGATAREGTQWPLSYWEYSTS